jgi:ribonuclease BN (tRNA processing enzyme)
MRLAFLGTGSAFSVERYNGAVVVDGRLLLDAGAPLLPHMHRLGIDPAGIEAIFITHCHGDHVAGLVTYLLHRAFLAPGRALPLLGPPGTEARLEQLFVACWGEQWPAFRERSGLCYRAAEPAGEVAGVRYEALPLDHGAMDCRGYRLRVDGRVLAYAGDTIANAALDELVRGADVAITEATQAGRVEGHTSWEDAQALAARHPSTRFFFNHVYAGSTANAAGDLEVVDV